MGEFHDVLHIQWLDTGAHVDHGWAPKEKYISEASSDKMMVDTVGFLMHEDEEIIMLALSYDPKNDMWYGAQLIHKSSIEKRSILGVI